ncbi:hypothetical protein GF312_12260 [Candidatus Poribacteria bacterium]|nr:hypothetical protein [Candidatus Poribacteria bacterium]
MIKTIRDHDMKNCITILVVLFMVFLMGCATIEMKTKVKKPVSMTNMGGAQPREFNTKSRAVWLFWGIIPLSVPKFDQIIVPNVADRSGVQNLAIKTQNSFVDVIVTTVTQGIITMRTIEVEGEVYY